MPRRYAVPGRAAVGKRPDEKALNAVLEAAWAALQAPDSDPAVRRATFVLAAAAARGSDSVRKELVKQVGGEAARICLF